MNAFKLAADVADVVDRTAWRQWTLAGLALVNAVFAAIMFSLVGHEFVANGMAYLLAVITALPVCVRDRRTFEVACRTSAVVLTLMFVPAFFYGSFGFLPSIVLLFVAGFRGRSRSRSRAWAATTVVLAALISASWSIAIWPALPSGNWVEWTVTGLLAG